MGHFASVFHESHLSTEIPQPLMIPAIRVFLENNNNEQSICRIDNELNFGKEKRMIGSGTVGKGNRGLALFGG